MSSMASAASGFRYVPLWPFGSEADAGRWQSAYRADGRQPWHRDAALTASSFTKEYLGYSELDAVVGVAVDGVDARVSVGYRNPNGAPSTAAVVHLVRFGAGDDAPWEVVGTDDTTLSLTTPGYAAAVSTPVEVGGRVTGVDESLNVEIRESGGSAPVGAVRGLPAGGENMPWSARVAFTARGGVLTIAVSTGGHVAGVERFAVTGVRR